MTSYARMFFIIHTCLIGFSCKQDKENSITKKEVVPASFYALDIGNYWIYETAYWDSNGIYQYTIGYDTTKVIGDTILGSDTFKIITSKSAKFKDTVLYYRQLGFDTYDQNGSIVVGPNIDQDTLEYISVPNQYEGYIVGLGREVVSTVAGEFECMSRFGLINVYDSSGGIHYQAEIGASYGLEIGLIKEIDFDAKTASRYEKSLLKYHVNNL